MKETKTKTDIGVIIGRFQLHEMHSEHIKLIDHVLNNHEKIVLFLGCVNGNPTKSNTLDFISRKVMIEEEFETAITAILPLYDMKENSDWSKQIDSKVRDIFPQGSVTIYGSRSSCLDSYQGNFLIQELEPEIYVSATEIREEASRKVVRSADHRLGQLQAIQRIFPNPYPTVDIAILSKDNKRILLGRKTLDSKYRFIGGFVDTLDESYEVAAKRELFEETDLEVEKMEYVCSMKIDDWRYRSDKDSGIMTTFFKTNYIFGNPQPKDDIAELKWFDITENLANKLVGEHAKLFIKLLETI